jgi:glycosyltransferase involved in cell wall biosynthesis
VTGAGLDFSVLLPVYRGDHPEHLTAALRSTVHEQTRMPSELVLVRDGRVPDALQRAIDELLAQTPVPVVYLPLDTNIGLARALERGLAAASHDVIARMDADDVSVPIRFEKQLPLIEQGADIVGSALFEFAGDIGNVVQVRVPPLDPQWIRSASRFRDPFNHPTVVYRRSAVRAAGGYQDMHLMEDYLLFARMLACGAKPANLAEPLVYYRVSEGAYARRGGRDMLRAEIELQRRFRREGITTRVEYLRNVLIRGGYRLTPESVRRLAYRRLIARRGIDESAVPGSPR